LKAVTSSAGACVVCGSTSRLTAHHLEPRREGGKVLITLCGLCHNRYHGDKRAGRDTELVRAVEGAPTRFVD
jgi:5-methylcytosine-specific restriction endonuclease McrA